MTVEPLKFIHWKVQTLHEAEGKGLAQQQETCDSTSRLINELEMRIRNS